MFSWSLEYPLVLISTLYSLPNIKGRIISPIILVYYGTQVFFVRRTSRFPFVTIRFCQKNRMTHGTEPRWAGPLADVTARASKKVEDKTIKRHEGSNSGAHAGQIITMATGLNKTLCSSYIATY